jgi:hypothetical protein
MLGSVFPSISGSFLRPPFDAQFRTALWAVSRAMLDIGYRQFDFTPAGVALKRVDFRSPRGHVVFRRRSRIHAVNPGS